MDVSYDQRDASHIKDAKNYKDAGNRKNLGTGTPGSAARNSKEDAAQRMSAVTRTPKEQVQLQKQR
jgi:hypothetical protein